MKSETIAKYLTSHKEVSELLANFHQQATHLHGNSKSNLVNLGGRLLWFVPLASIGLPNGTITSTLLGKHNIVSLHQVPKMELLVISVASFTQPAAISSSSAIGGKWGEFNN